jgi:hypothetical protein
MQYLAWVQTREPDGTRKEYYVANVSSPNGAAETIRELYNLPDGTWFISRFIGRMAYPAVESIIATGL